VVGVLDVDRGKAGQPFLVMEYVDGIDLGKLIESGPCRTHRRHYDMRATFITLAIDDGADPDVLETRVTHTRKSRSAFDGYNRGLQWERTCVEVSKLRITRGGRSSAAEQPIAAGSGEDSLVSLHCLQAAEMATKNLAARKLPVLKQMRSTTLQ
jgi:hypothetical protein